MTITLIGHLSIDEIHPAEGSEQISPPREDFGGIFFSLATLASLVEPGDRVRPVFGVGEKDYDALKERMKQFPAIDSSGVFNVKGDTNRVMHFAENGSKARIECSKHISEPIPFNKIKPFLDTDGLLINMVSGFDITLDTLDAIRMAVRESRTPIHFDFHSLTLGVDQDSRRFRRPLTDWRRWCFMLNSIQMTQDEVLGLTAEHYDEATLINQLMPLMVNALLITRGERGATAIVQSNKKLTRTEFEGTPSTPAVDPIGCGDVFGAAFLFRYLQRKDFRDATAFANQAAGLKSTFSGLAGMPGIGERLKTTGAAH